MSPTPASCPHEIRPGTVVCLHCRRDAQLAQAARTRALLVRAAGVTLAVGAVVAGSVALLRGDGAPAAPSLAVAAAVPAAVTSAAEPPAPATPVPVAPLRGAAATAAPRPAGPIIPEGRTELRGGVVAVRTGDTVAVHFDTPATRTRRRDKFERMVRATLPAIYGSAADSALAAIPAGRLAAAGDLLTELPTRGVHLPSPSGTLALWPATRPGRDGPLVVTYVATLVR